MVRGNFCLNLKTGKNLKDCIKKEREKWGKRRNKKKGKKERKKEKVCFPVYEYIHGMKENNLNNLFN